MLCTGKGKLTQNGVHLEEHEYATVKISSEPAKNKLVCTDADGNKLTVKLKKSGKKKVIQSVKVKIGKKTITLDKKQIKKSPE